MPSYLGSNYGGGNEDNGDLPLKSHAFTATFSAPNSAAGHHQPTTPPEALRHPQASPGQSPVGSLLLFFLGLGVQGSVVPSVSLFSGPC